MPPRNWQLSGLVAAGVGAEVTGAELAGTEPLGDDDDPGLAGTTAAPDAGLTVRQPSSELPPPVPMFTPYAQIRLAPGDSAIE